MTTINESVVVYIINGCDYVITPFLAKKTKEWYTEEYGEEVFECRLANIYKDGIWCEINEDEAYGNIYSNENIFGNVKMFCGSMCKYLSLETVLSEYEKEITIPFLVASSEY